MAMKPFASEEASEALSNAMLLLPFSCQFVTFVPLTALWKRIMPRIDVQRCWQFQSPYCICVGSFEVAHSSFMSTYGTLVSDVSFTPSSYCVDLSKW